MNSPNIKVRSIDVPNLRLILAILFKLGFVTQQGVGGGGSDFKTFGILFSNLNASTYSVVAFLLSCQILGRSDRTLHRKY